MPFAGNLRTLPLPDVFQTLNNIKATGVLRLRANAGSRDVVFQQGEIIGVGFLDKEGREDLELRMSLLGIDENAGEHLKGVTWYWTAMTARTQTSRAEMDELVHEQAREQLHNLFAWSTAEFAFDESGPGKTVANELVARSLERPLSIDTATILLEAAKQQDEWAELRARIRDETGAAAMGSSPSLGVETEALEQQLPEDLTYHLYINGEWQGPFPRTQIVGLVQTGEVASETWSYDPRTQDRKTLDQLLGGEARRITPDELESLRQAVQAAEGRLSEERAGRAADLAELRGLASEILRLAHDCQLSDPAITAVVSRLAEVMGGEDPSIVALAAETVIVAVVRHLRDLGVRGLNEAQARVDALSKRISETESERDSLGKQLSEAERRNDLDREKTDDLRQRLAAAAEDASRLNQELERTRHDPTRTATARISAENTPEDVSAARAAKADERAAGLERELGRMRAERARLHNEVAVLQARLDEDRARHEAELEASRALAGSMGEGRTDPPTERIGKDTERINKETERIGKDTERVATPDAELIAEIARLKARLSEAESRTADLDARRANEERERAAAERDAARGDTERLRKDLHQARAEAARNSELVRAAEQAETRVSAFEARLASADERVAAAERRAHQAEEDLAAARVALERAEASRREQERSAYEAARHNTELQVRLRELAARLDDGEARLAELDSLAEQLTAARARAAELEAEAVHIRADLATVRDAATDKLDRAKRRVGELRLRLREAKRDRKAMVPWSSPNTATFAAAQANPQTQVPWPSPATAAFSAAPGQPQAQVPWPSPVTAGFTPGQGGWQPQAQPGGALTAHGAAPELPSSATVRTTSGTFVPMPMPEDSSAQRPRVQLPLAIPGPGARPSIIRGPWVLAAAAGILVVLGLWWGATSAVPICDRARINGRTIAVSAPIPGRLDALAVREGTWVRQGDRLAVLRNSDLDTMRRDALRERKLTLDTRFKAAEGALRRAQAEHDKLATELAQPLPQGEADPRNRLREEYASRIVELQGQLDDLHARQDEVGSELTSEQRRLDTLREAEVLSPSDGLVWSIAGNGSAHASGQTVVTLIAADSLVIDAEVAAGTAIDAGARASVRLGSDLIEATVEVVGPDAARTQQLAFSAPLATGSRRVLLTARNAAALRDAFNSQARIAFTGGDPGVLGGLGLWLRRF